MAAGGDDEYIIVQTDATFHLVLKVLCEVRRDSPPVIQHSQTAEIHNIESANQNDGNRFLFGGESPDYVHQFSRMASGVLRMCMMRSAGIPDDHQPKLGSKAQKRNSDKLVFNIVYPNGGARFVLANDRRNVENYCSRYDHLHPHSRLKNQYEEKDGDWWFMPATMMLIFRNDFSELIEFNTTFKAREDPAGVRGVFESFVLVLCTVRTIPIKGRAALRNMFGVPLEFPGMLKEVRKTWGKTIQPLPSKGADKTKKSGGVTDKQAASSVTESMVDVLADKFNKIDI